MPTYCDEEIERIGRAFRDRSLPKPEWTHAAHFAAAIWVLRQADIAPEREMPRLIRAYNEATGVVNSDTSGYHETITLASLRAARAWLAAHPDASTSEALAGLLASAYGRPDWLLAHWTRERLFSPEARRSWSPPDLQPLPF